ncbi:MAG: methionyl-tRNA formyltransferase, partial [Paracoccaceae bacterium]
MGAALIGDALPRLDDLPPVAQPDAGVTYAAKIDKAEARIDWQQPAAQVDRQIRGLSPFPGAWTMDGETRIKLLASRLADGPGAPGTVLQDPLRIMCGDGAVELVRLQRAGKGVQDATDFLRGWSWPVGKQL